MDIWIFTDLRIDRLLLRRSFDNSTMKMNPISNYKPLLITLALSAASPAFGQDSVDERIEKLEEMMQSLSSQLSELKAERDAHSQRASSAEAELAEVKATQEALLDELASTSTTAVESGPNLPSGLQIGAYGEHHFNFRENGPDQSDIHRFVVFLGYEFNDWISFTSETELEHGFVDSNDGELILEQFYFDLNIDPRFNLRVGRILHPAGILNRFHEPTTFYGVERAPFAVNVLPSTWSIDGIGAFGSLTDWLSYEAYFHAGLDGSQYNAGSGVRGGRLKERPGLEDFGFSSRLDLQPLIAAGIESAASWRLGGSYSYIGSQNSDQGAAGNPSEGGVHIFALDTDVTYGDLEFRAEWAQLNLTQVQTLPAGVSDEIYGWYVEAAYHVFPDAWKQGKLKDADFVPFVRYSEYDTQAGAISGGGAVTGANARQEFTLGASFYPVSNVVFKADYTFAENDSNTAGDRIDLGVGYDF